MHLIFVNADVNIKMRLHKICFRDFKVQNEFPQRKEIVIGNMVLYFLGW